MVCVTCLKDKPENGFYLRGDLRRKKYRSECKTCLSRKAKARRLRKVYGLHEFDFFFLVKKAQGSCMLCNKPFNTPADINIDHDHETGRVRGVLCMTCNTGIGLLGDNLEGLQRAVDYLSPTPKKVG